MPPSRCSTEAWRASVDYAAALTADTSIISSSPRVIAVCQAAEEECTDSTCVCTTGCSWISVCYRGVQE